MSGRAKFRVDHPAKADAMVRDLKRAGWKLTPQRIAIVRQFASDHTHPTAQDLFDRLRADPALSFPSMSFATVYNTLDALAAAGLASALKLGGNAARFDPNTEAHHHVVCDACGAVRDVPAASLRASDAVVKKLRRSAPGFQLRAVEKVYRGLCGVCAKQKSS